MCCKNYATSLTIPSDSMRPRYYLNLTNERLFSALIVEDHYECAALHAFK